MSDEETEVIGEKMEVDASDSDSGPDEDELLEKKAKELEAQITEYPYSYDAHIELVDIYRKLFNLSEMRAAYERFHKNFPLTAKLWLDWIRDEMRVANTDNEKKYISELFDKAVEDYLSVDLWLEYVQYSIGQNDVEGTRKVFERAINTAGLHVGQGCLIWDAYREFELAHLSLKTDSETDDWKEQAGRVAEIFRRQLSVPLLEMERTYIEWRVWTERLPRQDIVNKDQVDWAYKKATKYIEDYQRYEDKLKSATLDEERLKIYREYIEDEGKLEIVRCLYERAVADMSLNPAIWYEFCTYFFKLGNFPSALSTSERALRNCPWNEDLWVFHIRALELVGKSHDDITQCLEKALLSGFQTGHQYLQVWLVYLEHYRRITDPKNADSKEKLREAFNRGHQHLIENFGMEADPDCTFLRLWAKIEADFLNDITAARIIWNDYGILKTLGGSANIWLELIALEQQFGDVKHVQKTYQRALSSTKDWPQCIVQSWMMYERQFGTVETIITCTNLGQKHMKKWNKEHALTDSSNGLKNESNLQKGQKRKNPDPRSATKDNERKLKQVKITDDTPKKQDKPLKEKDAPVEIEQKEYTRIDMDPEKKARSVFISNLDYGVTDDELKEFLGPVEELRLVKDRKGNSKGYAYCVFGKKEDAEKTLLRDRELIKGRPVFISECKVDKMEREPMFRYANSQEKHKLFVRGLPLKMTQEQLEDFFKPHGALKEVRLVTYRNGRSKGLAYVEFNDPNDASKAIIATDNTEVDGFIISVAISDPPKRKTDTLLPEVTRHTRTRIQIPLVPRSIQTATVKQTQVPMTNDDFRKMLSKK